MPGPAEERDRPETETWRTRVRDAAAVRSVPLATILATVGVVVGTGLTLLLLWVLRSEVLYVVVATFVAGVLTPPVRYLRGRGISHGFAATLVFLLGVVAFGGIVYAFTVPLISAVTRFAHEVPTLFQQAEHGRGRIGRILNGLHLQRWVSKNAPKLSNDIIHSLKPAQALSVGAAAASTVLALGTIAVLSFFVLLEAPEVWSGILGTLRPDRAARVVRVSREVSRSVSGFLLGNAVTSIIAGLVVLVTLSALGIPFALLLALWVALVDLLPLVGGLLAGVPVVLLALVHSLVAGIIVLVVFLVYQQVENHVLNPAVMSKTVRLNPLWVLLAVLVGAKLGDQIGGGLGAFAGALIGIPVGGAIQVVFRELRRPFPGEDGLAGAEPIGTDSGSGPDVS